MCEAKPSNDVERIPGIWFAREFKDSRLHSSSSCRRPGSTSPVHFFIGDHDDGESTSSLMQPRTQERSSRVSCRFANVSPNHSSGPMNSSRRTTSEATVHRCVRVRRVWTIMLTGIQDPRAFDVVNYSLAIIGPIVRCLSRTRQGSQPDATVSELGEPGAMHSSEEGTCPSPDSASDSMPSSPSSQNWSNDREVSSAVDAKLYQLPAIAVEKHELDHLSRCILEESETWMNWMHHGQGMPSQILWESLLHELCQLGESSRARAYFLAGAELGCRPSCLTRLADLCGDVEPPALLRSASESSVASVESLMCPGCLYKCFRMASD